MKQSNLLYKSNILSKFPSLLHGFTTKKAGDFRYDSKDILGKIFQINPSKIISMSQVHKNTVLEVKDIDIKHIEEVDGLVTKEKDIYLTVKVADCLPILLFDPKAKVVAICHAGWKGTVGGIQQKTIEKMKGLGAKVDDIVAVLGPHIEACCYKVPSERAQIFRDKINSTDSVVIMDGENYISLGIANYELLLRAGIKRQNLEAKPFCTSCQNNLFFSYRKEGENHGEQIGLIGMI